MLSKLEMKLRAEDNNALNIHKGSLLHGVIMENINPEYAALMHEQGLNPFTSYLPGKEGEYIWTISTLNDQAFNEIIMQFMKPEMKRIKLKYSDADIEIVEKKISSIENNDIMSQFYELETSNYFSINFITPTAFKSSGEYIFYPDLAMTFQSLMNKYNLSSEEVSFFDSDTLEQIIQNTRIVKYNLKSVKFDLEGIKIPSFIGSITIKSKGPDTMKRFIRLLLQYGEFSGVGIKCSLGMGAIKLLDKNGGVRNE